LIQRSNTDASSQNLPCDNILGTSSSYSARIHELSTSSMATAKTETTRGPTYSMSRAIGATATAWQKGFIHPCHYLHCHEPTHSGSHSSHGPTSPMATSMRTHVIKDSESATSV